MKLDVLILSWALALVPIASWSQTTDWKSDETAGVSETVAILGTKPTITDDRTFRVVFRLASMTNTEIPYAALYSGNDLHGWEAITTKLITCKVSQRSGTSNTPLFSGNNASDLSRYDGSRASMGRNRPVYLVTDFSCTGPIFAGDEVTIQTEFFFRIDLEWKKANYLFDNRVLAK